LRQAGGKVPLQIVYPVTAAPRDHKDRVEPAVSRQRVGKGEQAGASNQIDLVQSEDRFAAALG
jgi:hypothetical protein